MTNITSIDPAIDSTLNSPPDSLPKQPPVCTKLQLLPFGELTWENFERLCNRIAGKEDVECATRYGRSGQAQQGIDLFARQSNGKYKVWQAKRHDSLTAADVNNIVEVFRTGDWHGKSEQLILAVQCSLENTKVQNAIEQQARILKNEGIVFTTYGGQQLSDLLKGHPEIVDDFFGRAWVEAFGICQRN